MGYRLFLILGLFCCLTACQKNKAELTMPEEKFIKVLVDAHLLESTLQTNYTAFKDSLSTVYYGQLYEIHGITETDFLNNLDIMQSDAEMMSDIYSKVMDELSKYEAEYKK